MHRVWVNMCDYSLRTENWYRHGVTEMSHQYSKMHGRKVEWWWHLSPRNTGQEIGGVRTGNSTLKKSSISFYYFQAYLSFGG